MFVFAKIFAKLLGFARFLGKYFRANIYFRERKYVYYKSKCNPQLDKICCFLLIQKELFDFREEETSRMIFAKSFAKI
jgi:hypothetical protein